MQIIKANSYSDVFGNPVAHADLLRKTRAGSAIGKGFGLMGGSIGDVMTRSGQEVIPDDPDREVINKNLNRIKTRRDKAVSARALGPYERAHIEVAGLMQKPVVFPNGGRLPDLAGTPEQKKEIALKFLEKVLDPEIRQKYQGSMLVIEALPERLELKQKVFEFLSYVLPEDAILATNTSSLSIDEIAKYVVNPERVLGIHYFKPADQNEAAEIIVGPQTDLKYVAIAYNLLQAQGKKPIIVWEDKPLAVGNRIFVSVLRKAAELAERGLASRDQIDQIYLEAFYGEQSKVQFQKVKEKFKEAIKLSFFNDEAKRYKKIEEIDDKVSGLTLQEKERDILLDEKVEILKAAREELIQKMLYATVMENASVLGSAFKTPKIVGDIKREVQKKLNIIDKYLKSVKDAPAAKIKTVQETTGEELKPYIIPDTSKKPLTSEIRKQIKDELEGTFISAALQIHKEGLATIPDIETLAKTAFEYNTGPFTLAKEKGQRETQRLIALVNDGLPEGKETGIAKPEDYFKVTSKDLSGVQTYIQGDTATIEISWNQIQFLQNMSNSLTPEMLRAIYNSVKEFEANPNIKTIFIESKGGKVFGSGASLKFVDENRRNVNKLIDFAEFGYNVIETIKNCSKPVIGLADGSAVGGSGEILAACTRRYGTENASVMFPEKTLNLVPLWGGTENVPALIGKELSIPLMCTSKWLTADAACRAGFYDNQNKKPFLRSEFYQFKADLIAGKVSGVDIRNLKQRTPEYDKRIKDYDIRRQFGLGRLDKKPYYTHSSLNLLTRDSEMLIERFIKNAHDSSYRKREVTREKLGEIIRGALDYSAQTVHPWLWIAQNKYAARTTEILTGIMAGLGKFKKALFS